MKCTKCFGYGLWGIGDPVPIGKMDAQDMPTKRCDICGKGGKK